MKATEKLYRFDKSDSGSVHEWVQRLQAANAVMAYKPRNYVPEPTSPFFGLRPDTFLLILQWPWQRQLWSQIGRNFMGVDGTHNITKYKNMIFHTIMGRDAFGHGTSFIFGCILPNNVFFFFLATGVPIMWMFASNGEEAVYHFFFSTFLANNPVLPSVILTDKDVAQINALRKVFPSSRILLCWWHVLHDWYGRLAVHQHPEAWEKLIRLPRQNTHEEHESLWHHLQTILPADFIAYMQENWMTGE
jgi:MULE transposase domain